MDQDADMPPEEPGQEGGSIGPMVGLDFSPQHAEELLIRSLNRLHALHPPAPDVVAGSDLAAELHRAATADPGHQASPVGTAGDLGAASDAVAHGLGVLIQEGGDPLMDSPDLAMSDAQNEQQAALMAHAAAQARGAV